MPNPQDELDALRTQVASLTARVHRLEQQAGIEPQSFPGTTQAQPTVVAPPPPLTVSKSELDKTTLPPMPVIPPRREAGTPSLGQIQPRSGDDLEGTIGKLWLNRIGIIAILIGVAYFLKLAIDNNWIGPGGRVAIGLIAGIAVVLWSERFRR